MLSVESLIALLQAVTHSEQDRALGVIRRTVGDEVWRSLLESSVVDQPTPSARARRIGDVLRSAGVGRHLVNECYRAAFYAGDDWLALSRNPMFAMFTANKSGKPLDKWLHYFDIYEKHLAKFRSRRIRVLEIGVYKGGGQQMLRHYLGTDAYVMGIDIEETARRAAGADYVVEVGDQESPEFLQRVNQMYGPFDVVIDDGGHSVDQQTTSVEVLFPLLSEGGVYLVEDCHTSYWADDPQFRSKKSPGRTFIDWTKDRIDDINAYHHSRLVDVPSPWATHVDGLHIYDSVVVLEKRRRSAPFSEVAGDGQFLARTREMSAMTLAAASEVAYEEGTPSISASSVASLAIARDVAVAHVAELEGDAAELQFLREQVSSLRGQLQAAGSRLEMNWSAFNELRNSRSWKVTAPLRRTVEILRSR